jgi:membrane-associated phospholipid phosphatase
MNKDWIRKQLLFIVLAIVLLGSIIIYVMALKGTWIDSGVGLYFLHHYNALLAQFLRYCTGLGSRLFLVIAYPLLFCFLYFLKNEKKLALEVIAIALGGYVIIGVLKEIFHRARPLDPMIAAMNTYSFPSGHTATASIFFGILVYCSYGLVRRNTLRQILIVLFILMAGLVGLSRVYLREHFATDVLAAYCISYLYLVITLSFMQKQQRRQHHARLTIHN